MAGDFNMHLTELDKHGTKHKKNEFATCMSDIMHELDLVDIWRLINPDKRRYTWRKMTFTGISQSRLDYILIPNSWLYNVNTVDIGHSVYSDHSPVHLTLNEDNPATKGRGFWKFNNSLLRDKEYTSKVNELIDEELNRKNCTDKGLKWNVIKMRIRGYTVSYSSYKAKLRREYELQITDRLQELEVQISIKVDEDVKQEFTTVTRELEAINNEKTQGNQIRA
jgi:hypothetical protein